MGKISDIVCCKYVDNTLYRSNSSKKRVGWVVSLISAAGDKIFNPMQ